MVVRPNLKLKVILAERGITQRQLAFGTGYDESRISKVIKGYERPTKDLQADICKFLGVGQGEVFPWD